MNKVLKGIIQIIIMLSLGTSIIVAEETKILEFGSNLNFGEVNIGESVTQELTLYNRGNSDLTIERLRFHENLEGVYSGNFSGLIPAHGVKIVVITFTPIAGLVYNGLVYVESDKTNTGDYNRLLKGVGIDANNTVTTRVLSFGSALNFGDISVGDSMTKELILYNKGNSDLTITGLRFHENLKGVYSGNFSGVISSNGMQTVSITFRPNEDKIFNGLVYVNSDRTNRGDKSRLLRGSGVVENDIIGNIPVLTLSGDLNLTIVQGSTYIDLGAIAEDVEDGDITADIVTVSNVNTSEVGTYYVTYDVNDSDDNQANQIVREVTVLPAVQGIVRDFTTTLGLENIELSVGTQKVMTDSEGRYILPIDNNLSGRILITANGDGYGRINKWVTIEENTRLDINMLAVELTATFNPTENFTAQVPNSVASVTIEANSLVLEDGSFPDGDIIALLTPINPILDIDLMPGDMVTTGGRPIESYGAMIIEFKDEHNNSLNLANGEIAVIRIPVTTRGTTPSTIPLFYFDEISGLWIEEGIATLSDDSTYYEGTVSHFTTWNADRIYETINIHGCVEDINGTRVANAQVLMQGHNYNGSSFAGTDENGNFSIFAMRNQTSILRAIYLNQVSSTVLVGDNESTNTDTTVNECLIIGATVSSLSASLTWGANPRDLDTHVRGPNSYHIFYGSRGSLLAEPFAQLDVDDTSSYGPEVFTALSFPTPGTYHYQVYHFSGTSTITASPARVEVVINGETILFVPPEGQANNRTWNVFDIIVADDFSIILSSVQTWQ